METIIDKFGRVVIPKRIRQDLGLKPGSPLKIEEEKDRVIIRAIPQKSLLENREGVFVFMGEATEDIEDSIHVLRKERLKGLSW